MNKLTLILAACVFVGLAAADTARADHRSRSNVHSHSHYSRGGQGHHHHHSHYGSPHWGGGYGGYIGSHNVYRAYSSPFGLYGTPAYGYGCNPYGNTIGINRGGFGLYFRF